MAEWYLKVELLDYIKEISKGKDFKVVLVYTGLFLEDSLIVSASSVSAFFDGYMLI